MASGDLYFGELGQCVPRRVTVPPVMQVVPRRFGQVLGDSMNSVSRIWRPLAPPALLVFVPAGVATLIIFSQTGAIEVLDRILNNPGSLTTLPDETLAEFFLPFYRATALATVVNMLAAAFVFVVAHRLVVADIAGTTAPESLRGDTLRRSIAGFSAWVIVGVVATILFLVGITVWMIPATAVGAPNATSTLIAGFLLPVLLAPAFWLWISTSMSTPVIAVEGTGAIKGLRRSISLVRGRWWPTLGYVLLVGLFGLVAIQLIQLVAIPLMALGGLGLAVNLAAIVGILAQGLIVAGIGSMLTWWYVDLRARNETLVSEDLTPSPRSPDEPPTAPPAS